MKQFEKYIVVDYYNGWDSKRGKILIKFIYDNIQPIGSVQVILKDVLDSFISQTNLYLKSNLFDSFYMGTSFVSVKSLAKNMISVYSNSAHLFSLIFNPDDFSIVSGFEEDNVYIFDSLPEANLFYEMT